MISLSLNIEKLSFSTLFWHIVQNKEMIDMRLQVCFIGDIRLERVPSSWEYQPTLGSQLSSIRNIERFHEGKLQINWLVVHIELHVSFSGKDSVYVIDTWYLIRFYV